MPGGIHPPLDVIRTFPHPNYINPVVRDWTLAAGIIFLLILTVFIVCARLWARLAIQHNSGIDDVIIVLAMVRTLLNAFMVYLELVTDWSIADSNHWSCHLSHPG
jgi:hypothetical protein